jgi:glyoxylase-like metal-dependent hydrolase (beta-lactamase superfamily II)
MATYVLKFPTGHLAVDTGFPGGLRGFLAGLKSYGLALLDLKWILVTHTHVDHVGFLKDLVDAAPHAKVIATRETLDRLRKGFNPPVPGRKAIGVVGRIATRRPRPLGPEFAAVDLPDDRIILFDNDATVLRDFGIPGDLIALPGHTADSIGLLLDDGRLFCGDAAMNGFPGVNRHSVAAEDLEEYHASWDRILESSARTVYPAHGPKFPVRDLATYRHALKPSQIVDIPLPAPSK